MEPIADLDTLRQLVRPLSERRLAVYLTPEGRRGSTLTHGFHPPDELEKARSSADLTRQALESGIADTSTAPATDRLGTLEQSISRIESELAGLKEQVLATQQSVALLAQEIQALRQALGG